MGWSVHGRIRQIQNSFALAAQAMSTPVAQRNTAVASETLYGKSDRYISDQYFSSTTVARYGSTPTIAPTAIPASNSQIGLDSENGSLEIWSNRSFIDVVVSILAIRLGLWGSKRLPDSTNTSVHYPESLNISIPNQD